MEGGVQSFRPWVSVNKGGRLRHRVDGGGEGLVNVVGITVGTKGR